MGVWSAPRIRLTLRHFGVDNVAVLEGGIKAWAAEGGQVESGEPAPVPSVVVAAAAAAPLQPKAGFVRSMADVAANVSKKEFVVVDARSRGRFDGTEPEPRPDIPSGHIEGAKSVPFMSLLETDEKTGASQAQPRAH
jgi:thiosulfate/3-mercaptopyruvate sulfurtransferase